MTELERSNSGSSQPVVIVGAGPVGLCAALHFARFRIPCVIYEEDDHLSTAPKAGTITPRTLEIFSQVGAIEKVLEAGLRFDVVNFVERRQNRVLVQMLTHELRDDTAYPFVLNLPQSDTERILYEYLQGSGYGHVQFNHRVTALEQDRDSCRVTVEGPDGAFQVETPYVLACDGGRSTIRHLLQIEHRGITYPERFALVDLEVDLDSQEPRPSYLSYVFDPDEWLIIVRQPTLWRVLWPVPAEATELEPAEVERKLKLAIGDRPLKVLDAMTYKVHHRVAQKWHEKRVFLLGDAAHLITPVGGLGLNTGIQDVNNLVWKIAWVLRGWATTSLLDTYERERRPIAEFIASGLADRNRSIIGMKHPAKRLLRDLVLRLMRYSKRHRWQTAYLRSLLSTTYRSVDTKPGLVARLRNAVLPKRHPPVLAGDRAPDGILFGPNGAEVRLQALFGTAYVALTFADARSRPPLTPLPQSASMRHYLISLFDAPHDSDIRDRTFYDPGGALTRRFSAKPGTTYLIRPDGHVASIEQPGGRSLDATYQANVGLPLPKSDNEQGATVLTHH